MIKKFFEKLIDKLFGKRCKCPTNKSQNCSDK